MRYFCAAHTDKGNRKPINQDSLCVKIGQVEGRGQILMAVICDGMGGLSQGEVASATVVNRFIRWYEQELPHKVGQCSVNDIAEEWKRLIQEENTKLLDYGRLTRADIGTTITAFFVVGEEYVVAHVGDCRLYECNHQLAQITIDQTFVEQEIRAGRMTKEQAEADSRRNMLLQCIGVSESVVPEIMYGHVREHTGYLLCSDGFRHVLQPEEIQRKYAGIAYGDMAGLDTANKELVATVMARGERDNISVIYIQCGR